ncbi:MAG TPA: sugar phosphate isomerase/epimerase, partial [Firmicutes bacterium]|nr:sugar phosphate isomerase/epimerase [Bacillota bacterium]
MRLGVFTNSLGRYTPGEVAARVQELGLQAVQLELAFQGEKIRWSELSAGQCREIAAPFQERGIEIAAVAGYSNLVDPDENRRQVRVAELVHLLRCARDLGAEMVVTESGGMNERNPWQPDPRNDTEETWGRLRDTVAGLCRVAEEAGSRLLLEPFWAHVVNGPERMRRLRREVGSPALGFVLDPANLVTEQNAAAVGVMLDHL